MITMLVYLIEASPWIRKKKEIEKFENGSWHRIEDQDLAIITKLEGQVWLALMNLCLEPECKKKYHFSKQNQAVVLRLKEYIAPETVDQLPPLVDLQRYLEELTMMNPPDTLQPALGIQPISEIYDAITENVSIKEIIEAQKKMLLGMNDDQKKSLAARLAKMYDLNGVEELIEDPKCGKCGIPATQRCSLCKQEWYCRYSSLTSRPCQVKAWKAHKSICELLRLKYK